MVNPIVYEISDNLQKCKVLEVIEEFAEELTAISGKCMDVGCGPGDITKKILMPALAPNATMIGTDISTDMIDYANDEHGDDARLTFETLDIQTKCLPEKYLAAFNYVFSFHTLHWCSDIKQAFDNIYRMLQPGGSMLVLLVASHDIFDIFKMLAHDDRYASYIPDKAKLIAHFQRSANPRKELKNLLSDIGFKVYHCSHREMSFKENSVNKFLYSIMSITSFLDEMPHEKMEEFYKEFKREYTKRKIIYRQEDSTDSIVLDLYRTLLVYAKKL